MNLQLFILKSGKPDPDIEKVLLPFGDVPYEYIENDLTIVNAAEKTHDWYGVIYDNELISDALAEAIPKFLELAVDVDGLVMYTKRDEKYFKCPKLFRKHVKLRTDCLMPDSECPLLHILDGWVVVDD